MWQRVLRAGGAHPTAIDFARSAARANPFESLIDELAGTWAHARGAVLMGASFGGLLAIALANRLAARALVLLNPLPPAPWSPFDPSGDAHPGLRHWGLQASLAGTRRAIPELQPQEALLAFRGWRDFDRGLLAEARRGIELPRPACPVLVVLSEHDKDLSPQSGRAMAGAWGAQVILCDGSHVAPLLGPQAPRLARSALDWSHALSVR